MTGGVRLIIETTVCGTIVAKRTGTVLLHLIRGGPQHRASKRQRASSLIEAFSGDLFELQAASRRQEKGLFKEVRSLAYGPGNRGFLE